MKEKIVWSNAKRKISELKPFPGNPRKADEKQVNDLSNSLERFNLADPLVINTDGTVIGGNFRLKLLTEKKIESVDVRIPSRTLTQPEAMELNLRLNKNVGSWDFGELANFSEEMLTTVGWESEELDEIFGLTTAKDDFDAQAEYEKIKEPKVKLGDLYQLGEHWLLCGDAKKKEDVDNLLRGLEPDMIFIDPPYGIEYQGIKSKKEILKGDQKEEDLFELLYYSLIWNRPIYVCCNWQSFSHFEEVMISNDRKPKSCIVWDKGSRIQNLDKFAKQHEFILYWGDFGGKKTLDTDVWYIERKTSKNHPTSKPIELCERTIKYSSKRMGIVLDLFGGSGSTLIACEQLNRKCFMMEIDEKYCEVIINRWEKLTGKKAIEA